MNNSILVYYPSDSLDQLHVIYTIEHTEQAQTISCKVESQTVPLWLQLRKFSMTSLKKQGRYVPLFSEVNNSTNIDTSLFIDLVYDRIMNKEKLRVASSEKE